MCRQNILILTFIAVAVALAYFYFVVPDCLIIDRASCFVDLSALAPFHYRVLQPFLEKAINPQATQESTLWVDVILQSVLSTVSIFSLYPWLKRWSDEGQALFGVTLFAVAYIIAFHFYQRAIHTSIEIASVALMLALIGKTNTRVIFGSALIAVASLNRETSLLLPVIFVVTYIDEWRTTRFRMVCVWYFGIWVAITAALHIVLGAAPHQLGLVGTYEYNLAHLFDGIFTNLIYIPFAIAVVIGYRNSPPLLRRLIMVAGVYMLAIIVGASWRESQRLILPVLPLVIPVLLISSSVPRISQPTTTTPR